MEDDDITNCLGRDKDYAIKRLVCMPRSHGDREVLQYCNSVLSVFGAIAKVDQQSGADGVVEEMGLNIERIHHYLAKGGYDFGTESCERAYESITGLINEGVITRENFARIAQKYAQIMGLWFDPAK